MQKAGIVKGTRDFGPVEVAKRRYIFNIIENVFKQYGFSPIETPSLERLDTLTGKYGDEGDQLLFKILKNGEIQEKAVQAKDSKSFYNTITDKGLRYDLTVPFARFVSMNRHQLKLPFKRYQMQPVWRADRPQRGRYREFWQCDADSIGTKSLICEMECLEMFDKVFSELGIAVNIHLNHRKLLEAVAEKLGLGDHFEDFTVAIDKLDKIGMEGVIKELNSKNLNTEKLKSGAALLQNFNFQESSIELIKQKIQNQTGKEAIEELNTLLHYCTSFENKVILDLSLARGLSYYTGCIFEVKPINHKLGSVAAGGRYDDLTSIFGVKDVSGVGISFGADRIYDLLEQQEAFPKNLGVLADILVCSMDDEVLPYASQIARTLRDSLDKRIIQYPDAVKLKKQLDYANHIGASHAIILGSQEFENQSCMIKNLNEGTQHEVTLDDLINFWND